MTHEDFSLRERFIEVGAIGAGVTAVGLDMIYTYPVGGAFVSAVGALAVGASIGLGFGIGLAKKTDFEENVVAKPDIKSPF
ncbi:MAG: hypothetical protein KAJ86_04125 [Alphaproteobacteria bacterium]|nr:hypothetical protein [Alphaproteobacteria bacterium]